MKIQNKEQINQHPLFQPLKINFDQIMKLISGKSQKDISQMKIDFAKLKNTSYEEQKLYKSFE